MGWQVFFAGQVALYSPPLVHAWWAAMRMFAPSLQRRACWATLTLCAFGQTAESASDYRRVANDHLDPASMIVVAVGEESKIRIEPNKLNLGQVRSFIFDI